MIATKLKLRVYGDPCLRRKSAPVSNIGPAERMLISSMIKTMYDDDGVGLAAPQVGINQTIFVVDIGEGPVAVINPKIVKKIGKVTQNEGCLSVPGVTVAIDRPQQIRLHYLDENGHEQEGDFADLKARVIAHEMDHLDGKLIVDHVNPADRPKVIQKVEAKLKVMTNDKIQNSK
ncbi:MAG: peptide deformylase [Candidatus Omnitrophica bacterium]|nr:peptide deformylase [Candidatus Omnitrophota bacterium]